MGKKKKDKIRNSFIGWDDMSPEDQMRNADMIYMTEKSEADITTIGKKAIPVVEPVDRETGLSATIVNDISKTFPAQKSVVSEDASSEEHEVSPDDTPRVEEEVFTPVEPSPVSAEEVNNIITIPSEETPVEEDNDEVDVKVISFLLINRELGIVNISDGTTYFGFNIHNAIISEAGADIDVNSDPKMITDIINVMKMSLIMNRYPAALFTKSEFASEVLPAKGTLDLSSAGYDDHGLYFVDVLDKYIAAYIVDEYLFQSFISSIKDIIPEGVCSVDEAIFRVWCALSEIDTNPNFSFFAVDEYVERFYQSEQNNIDKEKFKEYIKAITDDSDEECDVSIIQRSATSARLQLIMDQIFGDDEDDVEDNDDDDVDENVDEEEDDEDALLAALEEDDAEAKTESRSDDSMVIPVIHKGE